jgi:hypothetical protein
MLYATNLCNLFLPYINGRSQRKASGLLPSFIQVYQLRDCGSEALTTRKCNLTCGFAGFIQNNSVSDILLLSSKLPFSFP